MFGVLRRVVTFILLTVLPKRASVTTGSCIDFTSTHKTRFSFFLTFVLEGKWLPIRADKCIRFLAILHILCSTNILFPFSRFRTLMGSRLNTTYIIISHEPCEIFLSIITCIRHNIPKFPFMKSFQLLHKWN